MLLRVEHETRLTYTAPVSETVLELRMAPLSNEDQTVLNYRLSSTPTAQVTSYRDGFGNRVDLLNVLAAHDQLTLRAVSHVRTHRRPACDRLTAMPWPLPPDSLPLEALDFLTSSPLVGAHLQIDTLAGPHRLGPRNLAELTGRLVHVVRDRLVYEKKATDARTPVLEALRLGKGVCQDFAHLLIGLCRSLGLPARYVSGYIHHPGEIATHAWCQVWAGEEGGWVDLDPTHTEEVGDGHVVTALGRDYADVPPNRGVWKGTGTESMTVAVKVDEMERVPADWADMGPAQPAQSAQSAQRSPGLSPAVQRLVRVGGAAYKANVRLLYRHQQEQQQQQPPPQQ